MNDFVDLDEAPLSRLHLKSVKPSLSSLSSYDILVPSKCRHTLYTFYV